MPTSTFTDMHMGMHCNLHCVTVVQVESGSVDVVNHFMYLSSSISREGDITVELDCRIAKAARAFWQFKKAHIPTHTHFYCHKTPSLLCSGLVNHIVWS